LNRYAYAEGDPVNFNDPLGRYEVYTGSGLCTVGAGEGAELVPCDSFTEVWASPFGPNQGKGGAVKGLGKVTITTSGVNRNGPREDEINIALETLDNIVDPDCRAWLQGGVFGNLDTEISEIVQNGVVGHGSISTNQPDTVVNAVTNPGDAPGFAIVINDNGAFYNSSVATDNGNITGGDLKADIFILLHELGHLNQIPGFLDDSQSSANGKTNNITVEQKCSKTLAKQVLN
jgi:hypothetical protein